MTLQEISGSLGDLGTFLPLVTALAVHHVDGVPQVGFGPALFFAGIFTLWTGTIFQIPIPVQPMKTIASVALLGQYTRSQIMAAGISIAACMLFLGATKLITLLQKITPIALVRGIQLGLGIALMIKGIKYAYVHENAQPVWLGADSVLVSILLGIFCLGFHANNRVPTALVIFFYGIVIAIFRYSRRESKSSLSFGPDFDVPVAPSLSDFRIAFFDMVLPQLPLTILNSVIALEKLSHDLFPGKAASVERTSYSISFGNGVFCWFGMLPMCHGAGGLASQYAFGARSSVSMLFLGTIKITVALLFGSTSLLLLQEGVFPSSVLGILLTFSGLNLALVATDIHEKHDAMIMLMTTGMTLARNTGVGFVAGSITALVLHYASRHKNRPSE